ncbi:MAG TPA: flagellar assembly peptidoglycan hydrolase FlgJ, partial [Gammaproteobacteria bacterium]
MVSDNTAIYTDFQGFTDMRREAREQSPEAIKQVAQQFETLFVQMMLNGMRDTLPEGGLFGSNEQRMYQDMFDKQVSMNVTSGKGIGLAAVIERQLGGNPHSDAMKSQPLDAYLQRPLMTYQPVVSLGAADVPYRSMGETPVDDEFTAWSSPEAFVNDLWPHALRASQELGVDAEVLLAQSALETGWGRHMRARDNGEASYALFGIKADQRWEGQSVSVSTLEFRDGTMQREQAKFRAYNSVGEAFADYVDFIKSSPRYQQALEKGYDPEA